MYSTQLRPHQEGFEILGTKQEHLHHSFQQVAERSLNRSERSQRKLQVLDHSSKLVP
jgi:hypothetical protein